MSLSTIAKFAILQNFKNQLTSEDPSAPRETHPIKDDFFITEHAIRYLKKEISSIFKTMELEEKVRKEKQHALEEVKSTLRSQETKELLCREIPPRPVTPLPRDYSKTTIKPKGKEKKTILEGRELLQPEEQEKPIHKEKKKIKVNNRAVIVRPRSSGLTSEERKTCSIFKGISGSHSY